MWLIVATLAAVILLLVMRVWELRQDLAMERASYNAMAKRLKTDNDVLMNFVGAIENMAQGTRNKVEAK